MLQRRSLLLATGAALALSACGRSNEPVAVSKPATPADAYALGAQAHGFEVGALMAANTIYVYFDAQCPHCAVLWQQSQPLLNRIKMKWIPVGLLNKASTGQGATILAAADPAAAMAQHEASFSQKQGGITAPLNLADEAKAKVAANTKLFEALDADGVPLVLFKHARTGQFGRKSGAMSTEQLAGLVGV